MPKKPHRPIILNPAVTTSTASRALTGVGATSAVGSVGTSGGTSAISTLRVSDLTYLGSYAAPQTYTSTLGPFGAFGFYLRHEPADTTNPVHLGMGGYKGKALTVGGRVKLEMRGSVIKVYINEGTGYALLISYTDPSPITSAGRAGFAIGATTGFPGGYAVNDFSATNAGGSAFVTDTMDGVDGTLVSAHTGSLGATWTLHPAYASTAEIRGNRIVSSSGGGGAGYYASGTPSSADYDVEASIEYIDGTSLAGVAGRMNTSATTFYVAFYDANNTAWILARLVGGAYENLAIAPAPYGNVGQLAEVWEWRDATPTIPSNPTLSTSYGTATLMKNWGPIAGPPYPTKRAAYQGQGGAELYTENANGQAGTTPWYTLGWDQVASKLYSTIPI